jgi:hypothetical protein
MARTDDDRRRPSDEDEARRARHRHIDALLDAALVETFPASDPVSISSPLLSRDRR